MPSGPRWLENAVELGINFFDTADTYGDGYGEEILARVLGHKRNDLVIATKFGYDIYDPTPRDGHRERPQKFDREFVKFACEQSLRRLDTDYIDLYQIHNPRVEALERDELFETLEQLQFEGKIRHYGVALGPDIGWFEEGEMSMRERQVDSLQIIYSILEMEPAIDFFPIAEEREVGLLSRVPHASNTLTGEFTEVPEFDPSDHRAFRRAEWMREAAGQGGAGQVPGPGGLAHDGAVGVAVRAEEAANRVGAAQFHEDGRVARIHGRGGHAAADRR